MEPTNYPFGKENDLPNLHDYVPCLSSGEYGDVSKFFLKPMMESMTKGKMVGAPWDVGPSYQPHIHPNKMILLMEEILHQPGCIKPCE